MIETCVSCGALIKVGEVECNSCGTDLRPSDNRIQRDISYDLDEWGNPYLILDSDVKVYISFWTDNTPYVMVETSPDSDSWEKLEVWMNDAKAVKWE